MVMPKIKTALFSLLAAALLPAAAAAGTSGTVAVFGSSVAKGYVVGGDLTNGSYTAAYAGRLTELLEPQGWSVTNLSVPGNDTAAALARFDSDLVPVDPDIVLIGLSLGNEGLAKSIRPEVEFNTFAAGMSNLIERCRSLGAVPAVTLVYPNSGYSQSDYELVRRMNLLMNSREVPSVNLLGALDDGAGQWVDGYRADALHPNIHGYEEFFYTIVPTLFDAIRAGKTNRPSLDGTTGYVEVAGDAGPAPLVFAPSNTVHSFSTSFRVRAEGTGTVAAVRLPEAESTSLLIDFGGVGGDPAGSPDAFGNYWNNATDSTYNTELTGMAAADGGATSIGLRNESTFGRNGGSGAGGLLAPDSGLLGELAVADATEDYWYTTSTNGISVSLTGLNPAKTYSLNLFGTRETTSTRITRYEVTGGNGPFSALLQTSGAGSGTAIANGNDDTVVSISGVVPDASNEIQVKVIADTGGFAYLGLLKVTESDAAAAGEGGSIEVRSNAVVYTALDGTELSAPAETAGRWIDVALSHSYARQQTVLFIDGVRAGAVSERIAPERFVLGGSGGMAGRPPAPVQAAYQNWCVYRSSWTADEALAQHNGALQQASMEVCAPLNDLSFTQDAAVTNLAQSLSVAIAGSTNLTAGAAVVPPGGLTAASFDGSSAELAWIDNSLTESGYVVERRRSNAGEPWVPRLVLNAGAVSCADTGLIEGAAYDYRVASREGALLSGWSVPVSVVAGADAQSYRTWRDLGFSPDSARYQIDFNDGANPDHEGEIWNTVTGRTAAAYALSDSGGDASAEYTIATDSGFDASRSGNGSALSAFPADAQSTLFAVTSTSAARIVLSGLNRGFGYDVTLFGRRAPVYGGYDYRTRYTLDGSGPGVSFEASIATNETAYRIPGLLCDDGELLLDVAGADFPTGAVFAGISLLTVDAIHPADQFLIDFNASETVYPTQQAWNRIGSHTDSTPRSLLDAAGSSAAGYSLTLTDAFSGVRSGNGHALGGFPPDAEDTLYHGPAQMVLGGLDPALSYDFTFLARRGTVSAGYDYSGTYLFSGAGTPVTNVVDAAKNQAYSVVEGVVPDGGGTITLSVLNGPGAGIDFPVLNLLRMVRRGVSAGNRAASGPDDDPDGDGLVNLVEYALDLDPLAADDESAALRPVVSDASSAGISLSYVRRKAARDVSYVVQTCTNLAEGAWTEEPGLVHSVTGENGVYEMMEVERSAEEPSLFLRIGLEEVQP